MVATVAPELNPSIRTGTSRHRGTSQNLNEERMDKWAKVPRGFEVGDKGEHNLHPAELRLFTGLYNGSVNIKRAR